MQRMQRPPPTVRDPGQLDASVPWRGVPWGWGLAARGRAARTAHAASEEPRAAMPTLFAPATPDTSLTSSSSVPERPTPAGSPLPPGARRKVREQREALQRRCEHEGHDPHDLVPGWKGYQGSSPRQLWALEQALGAPSVQVSTPAAPSEEERRRTTAQGEAWLR